MERVRPGYVRTCTCCVYVCTTLDLEPAQTMRALEVLLAGFPSSSPLVAAELPRVGFWCFVPKSLPQSSFAICACLKNTALSLPKLPNELPMSNRSFIPSRHCQPDPVPSLNAGAGAAGSKGGTFSGPVDSYCTLKGW